MDEVKATYLNAECSAILQNQIPPKLEDPGSFLITYSIRTLTCKALADLGASINLMPYSVWSKLASGVLRPTRMSIRLADHSFQYPIGIAENMTVRVGHIVFFVDFVILKMEEDTKHAYSNDESCFRIDVIDDALDQEFQELMDTDMENEEITCLGARNVDDEELFAEVMALSLDDTPPLDERFEEVVADGSSRVPNSVDVPPTDLELKPLPTHLEYAYLSGESSLLVIISS
uniref:uncharacterized protein LOC122596966 n=1 Tax=Erigeron canadensis TaxID=72917 RepID=UPI001CB8AB3E|nr:uncharacterized protein LOC122596966 [Erigeron canadensis]